MTSLLPPISVCTAPPSTNPICEHCTRFAARAAHGEDFLSPIDHHPSIWSLIHSAESCPFCWYLTEWIGEDGINNAKRAVEASRRCRLKFEEERMANDYKGRSDWVQAKIQGLGLWKYSVETHARYFKTNRFLAT